METWSHAYRSAARSASLLIAGVLLSGPLALLAVAASRPQPAWRDAATFAAAYHPVQLLPYAGGFVLIAGFVALVASLHRLAPPEARTRAHAALILTAAFAALIVLNYVLQTTVVPGLVTPLRSGDAPLVELFAMANPRSLAWALEMWGYAVLGVATWCLAPVFAGGGLERAARLAFVANGVVSVAGGVLTAARPGWVQTPGGLAAFAGWNALVVVMAALVIAVMRRRRRGAAAV